MMDKNFANLWLTRSGNMASQNPNPQQFGDLTPRSYPHMGAEKTGYFSRNLQKPLKFVKVWRVRLENLKGG